MLNPSTSTPARPMPRRERRLEERRRAKAERNANAGPLRPKKVKALTDQLDATTGQQLTEEAHRITRTTYGPHLLSQKHDNALFYIAARLTHMVTGHAHRQFDTDTVRLAYGLQCGGGKTLSALSWITAVHRLGLPYSVAMAANEVKGLIELRKQLIEDFGVPADKIGLLHRMGNTVSVASTPDGELAEKQFLLVTHNMVQTGAKNVALYNTYQNRQRDLVIYDESLVVSEAFSLKHKNIQHGLDYVASEIKFPDQPGANDHLIVIRKYLEDTLALFLDEVDAQQRDHKKPGPVMVPFLSEYAEDLFPDGAKRLLPARCPRAVHALLDVAGREVRPVSEVNRGVVWFTVKVPDELKNVFVLDASHLIRALPTLGGNLIEDKNAVDPDITFPNVSVEYFKQPAGRGAITAECLLPVKQRTLAKKIAAWINTRPEGERVTVWTFKTRDARMEDNGRKKFPDIKDKLTESLEKFGVDMSRVTILTHGQAQGVPRQRVRRFLDTHRGTPQVNAAVEVMSNLITFGIESGYRRSLPGAPPATTVTDKVTVSRPRSHVDTTFTMADEELRRLRRAEVEPIRALETVLTVRRFVRDNRRGSVFARDHTALKYAIAGQLFKMVRKQRLNSGSPDHYPPASGTAKRAAGDVIQALLGVFFANVLSAIDQEDRAVMDAKQVLATPFTTDGADAD